MLCRPGEQDSDADDTDSEDDDEDDDDDDDETSPGKKEQLVVKGVCCLYQN